MSRIRFVVHAMRWWQKSCGNSYWLARVYSTMTGKSALRHTDGESNAKFDLEQITGESYSCLTIQTEVSHAQWARLRKQDDVYKPIDVELVAQLESH